MATKNSTDWRSKTAITVAEALAAQILPLSRNGLYDALSRGDLPSIRVGSRVMIPVAALRRLLGEIADG